MGSLQKRSDDVIQITLWAGSIILDVVQRYVKKNYLGKSNSVDMMLGHFMFQKVRVSK